MRERWLFHATNFQTLMYPCFIMCRIFGTFPYKINNSIFEVSKPYYIISIAIISIIYVFELEYFYNFKIFTKGEFEGTTWSFEYNCYIILNIFMIIVTFISSNSRMQLLQTIMKISVKLSPQSYRELSRLIHAKDIFGFLYVIGMIVTYSYKGVPILHLTFSIHSVLFNFHMNMLYINCVCLLKACFKEIDNNLSSMKELVLNEELQIPRMIYYKQRSSFLIIMKLKALKKQHFLVSNAVQMLNITFSLQLLITITLTFVTTSGGLYSHLLLQWDNGLVIKFSLNEAFSVMFLTSMMYQIIKMMLLVWACETGKNQARDIGTTIHDILNNTKDEQIKAELQLFSLQILHRDNTFSAKGFNIDAVLFARMMGTISTYSLILLQFFIISHSCDKNSKLNITQITKFHKSR